MEHTSRASKDPCSSGVSIWIVLHIVWAIWLTYHHVLDSALSRDGGFLLFGPDSRLMPIARAVLIARPTYMYDTSKGE